MENDEKYKDINSLIEQNTKESLTEALEIINNQLEQTKKRDDFLNLKKQKIQLQINLLNLNIEDLEENDYSKRIQLRGKIIHLYKELLKEQSTQEEKYAIQHKIIEELQKHKETIQQSKKNTSKTIPISKKLGLAIKDMGTSMDLLMRKKDVITKVKNIGKETATGTISAVTLIGGVSLAVALALGSPFTLSTLVSAFPILAYTGLSSIIRNVSNKTSFEKYEYQQSDEYKAYVKMFNETHQEEILQLAELAKQKEQLKDREEILKINGTLIEQLDNLSKATDIEEINRMFKLQALSFYYENKKICEEIKDEYLEEKNNDKEKYIQNNKRLTKINLEIFKRSNSIDDAIKNAKKGFMANAKVMVMAKAILSCVAPEMFAMKSAASLLEPLAFALINGLIDIPTYQGKLKFQETEYEGKIKVENKERIAEILERKQQPSLSYA